MQECRMKILIMNNILLEKASGDKVAGTRSGNKQFIQPTSNAIRMYNVMKKRKIENTENLR